MHHIPNDRKDHEPLLALPDKIPIAGGLKDTFDLFHKFTVWLDTYGWATPGFRVGEEGARACAWKFHHAQVVDNS